MVRYDSRFVLMLPSLTHGLRASNSRAAARRAAMRAWASRSCSVEIRFTTSPVFSYYGVEEHLAERPREPCAHQP